MITDHPDYPWYAAMGPFATERDAERATLADANRRCMANRRKAVIDWTASNRDSEYDLLQYAATQVYAGHWRDGYLMRADVHEMHERPSVRTGNMYIALGDESDDREVRLALVDGCWQDARWCEIYHVHVTGGPSTARGDLRAEQYEGSVE